MIDISASVLNVEKENATRTFYNLETSKINYFHIDAMDGKFVENNNLKIMKDYALTIKQISNLGLDVHLMVENPEEIVEDFFLYAPDIITFHIEATQTEERTKKLIKFIKSEGVRVGIAINPETNIDEIKPYLDYIHLILVMTVVPGKGGQKLIPETLNKVRLLKEYVYQNNIDIDIEVDGGINDITAKDAIQAGANILVAGMYILKSENMSEAVKKLRIN